MDLKLLKVQSNTTIDAKLVALSDKHLEDFDSFWKERLQNTSEEDSHWNWVTKNRYVSGRFNYEQYALECENITQGFLLLEVDFHHSRIEIGKPIVYIDFLATAPWNRRSLESSPIYKGVGSILFRFSIARSHDLEYQGRIGLHSLPRAESFYQKQGMKNLGPDPEKQNLVYFEI